MQPYKYPSGRIKPSAEGTQRIAGARSGALVLISHESSSTTTPGSQPPSSLSEPVAIATGSPKLHRPALLAGSLQVRASWRAVEMLLVPIFTVCWTNFCTIWEVSLYPALRSLFFRLRFLISICATLNFAF